MFVMVNHFIKGEIDFLKVELLLNIEMFELLLNIKMCHVNCDKEGVWDCPERKT